jgi:hypothetical protein
MFSKSTTYCLKNDSPCPQKKMTYSNKMHGLLNAFFLSLVILNFVLASCTRCDCKETFDSNKVYQKGDLVIYSGKCWKAVTQGQGIVPGPWQQNGNDIWTECMK